MATKKNKIPFWVIILFLILVVFAGIAVYKSKYKVKPKSVTFYTVEKKNIVETVSASGKIFPETEVKISSDVSGEIVELYVHEGDSVVIGQVLAKINPDAYISAVERGEAGLNNSKAQLAMSKSQIESSNAQKEQIMAQLENAKAIHKRNETLKKEGVISQADFDQSYASVKQLEANLRAAESSVKSAKQNSESAEYSIKASEASLKELKTSLNKTTIKAPTSGIISKLSVEKGERVVGTIQMTGTEMMRISNLNAMEVQVDVSENDIPKVAVGDDVNIEVDAYLGKTFKGKVSQVANSASNIGSSTAALNTDKVTNFTVKIRVSEASYSDIKREDLKYPLRPGMSASVEIFTKTEEGVVAVPIQSVTIRMKDEKEKEKIKTESDPDIKDYDEVVFLTTPADTARMVKVTTGIQNDEFIQILSGVQVSDKIISGPYNEVSKSLKSGDLVKEKVEKNSEKK
ncbi:MAG: efflux RND transporter periplasmic adaptor subunit [Lewinellaceae bacterium]|nr:efflux RND transporter periplasmic adaptor subunit [Lewinellaceae bacterium]